MKMTGAQIIVECLKEQGVKKIFGYPGAATINIYDELYKNSDSIEHILTSHEQGAAHAADGYSRSTKEVGVCLATSGPGATNLVTGIATAYMDSVPMVAITGNVAINKLGKDSFQEVDIHGITMPITKHNYMVKDITKLADIIREAFYIAKSGRQGPVLIDIPKNITSEITDYEPKRPKSIKRNKGIISKEVINLINLSKRPMIYAGGGIKSSFSSNELIEFAEKINAPVACSLMGVGSIPTNHKLYTGMVGMHGTLISNNCFNECDLLICLGARFSERVVGNEEKFASNAKIIQFDIDPAEINKNILVDEYIIGDLKETMKELNNKVNKKENSEWIQQVNNLKEEYKYEYDEAKLNVPLIIKKIGEYANSNAIISTDVGQHQMWTAQHYPFTKENIFLTSGGLGTMGYGLGAVIGAKFANKDRQAILITGDGSFRMNFNEIITAVRNKLAIKIFLMNNKTLGMVRQWQDIFYNKRFSATHLTDDVEYNMFAKSLGATGYTVNSLDELNQTLEDVFNNDKVCIVNCNVETSDIVYPMVPPGNAIHEAIIDK